MRKFQCKSCGWHGEYFSRTNKITCLKCKKAIEVDICSEEELCENDNEEENQQGGE